MINRSKITAVFSGLTMMFMTACGSSSGSSEISAVTTEQKESSAVSTEVTSSETESTEKEADNMLKISVNGKEFTAETEKNDTVRALGEILPLTLDMSELNGNEKYYYLDTSLPSDSERVGHINEGDIMLYGDSCLVVFYKSFDTSYSYTKIGHITDTAGLYEALGDGGAEVTFESFQYDYTVQDLKELNDFILGRSDPEALKGKPYDLDGDGVWNSFDLCLMRMKVSEKIPVNDGISILTPKQYIDKMYSCI